MNFLFTVRDRSKIYLSGVEGKLPRLLNRKVRQEAGDGNSGGPQSDSNVTATANFLGLLNATAVKVDLPSQTYGRRSRNLHNQARSDDRR